MRLGGKSPRPINDVIWGADRGGFLAPEED